MKLRTSHIITILLMFLLILPLQAKDFTKEEIKKNLPKMLGANNVGREFYFSFIPCWESPGLKNDLKLYISSGVETLVKVTVPGKGYEKIKPTIPNDIIEFTLSPAIGQPYRKTDREIPEPDQVWRGAAVHVEADDPIICYGVTRYQYTSDGFLAIPVPALGKEYIVASFADPVGSGTLQYLNSYFSATAAYDKTKVRFTMGGTDWSRTASGTLPGETTVWNLNEGDVLLIAAMGHHSELTGSKLDATKPIGVISGNFCAYIPTNCAACDVIEEMELPTTSWGTEYHVTRIAERLKNSIIKIFAKEAKTKIYRDHNNIGFLRNAGGTEGPGFVHMRADDGDPRPIVIGGDKPISVTQFNCGQLDDGIESDPFQLVLTPVEQYQREIVFNTPGIRGGFGFSKNYLNLCYEATQWGTIPEDLMFAQVEAGEFAWLPLADMSPSPGQPFEKVDGGKIYYSKEITLPGDGVYKIKSSKPFTAYAYGFSWCDSYGFPTSVALGDLTKVDTLPPEPEWLIDCWGNVNDPANPEVKTQYVTDKPDDPLNRSNLSTIYLHSDKSYNIKLYHDDFMPCEDPTTTWYLRTIDNTEDSYGVVTFADCAGNDTTLIIEFNAVKLRIVPKEWDFGRHSVGETSEQMFYVVNESETSSAFLKYLMLKNKDENKTPKGFTLWDSLGVAPFGTVFGGEDDPGIEIEPKIIPSLFGSAVTSLGLNLRSRKSPSKLIVNKKPVTWDNFNSSPVSRSTRLSKNSSISIGAELSFGTISIFLV
ncbi:IgGFc-binding protein [Bacteroidota bacterium]